MEKLSQVEHIYSSLTNNPERKEEIADILSYMDKHTIETLHTLATYYYGTDKEMNYGAYTKKWSLRDEDLNVKNKEYLYTLIQYKGEDILLHVGTGEFTPDVFTRRDIPQLLWLSHSPLPLFVVPAWVKQSYEWEENEEKYKHNIITRFLEEHAIIYSPKWWQAESRDIHKPQDCPINYGESNGIKDHRDTIAVIQNAIIMRMIKESNDEGMAVDKEKIIKEMEYLQKFSKLEFVRRSRLNQKHYTDTQKAIWRMLKDMTEEKESDIEEKDEEREMGEDMYAVLKMFNVRQLTSK